jgi:hypothetical protein
MTVTAKTTIFTKRGGIFVLPLPALLLLPALHFHPAHAHTHGAHSAHQHPPLVHADFFPTPSHTEGEHQHEQRVPEDHSSPSTPQVNFVTRPGRSLALSLFAPAQTPVLLSFDVPLIPSLLLVSTRVRARDHAPPVLDLAFPPTPPRAPPFRT